MKFTMDGGLSAYDYKNEEDEPGEDVNFKALAGNSSAMNTGIPTTQCEQSTSSTAFSTEQSCTEGLGLIKISIA